MVELCGKQHMATRWDADEWSERAVRALVPLAQSTTAQSYGAPPLASGEYRAFPRLAKSDERARAYFDHLLPKLNDDPQHLTDLVCSHPGIKSVVRGTGDERAVFLRMPSSGSLLQLNLANAIDQRGASAGLCFPHRPVRPLSPSASD